MRLSLEKDIAYFSKCPQLYTFSKTKILSPPSMRLSIIERVIKKAYIRRTDYEKKTEWRSIVGWIDKEVFANVDIENEEAFNAGRKLAENILTFVQKWYEFDYIRDTATSYINVPVIYDFVNSIVLGNIPILQVSDIPTIIYIDELEYDNFKIYNNIVAMGWACMLLEELDIDEIKVSHLSVGPEAGIKRNPVTVKKTKCEKVRSIVKQIVSSIEAGIYYPSFTAECSFCPFRQNCRI